MDKKFDVAKALRAAADKAETFRLAAETHSSCLDVLRAAQSDFDILDAAHKAAERVAHRSDSTSHEHESERRTAAELEASSIKLEKAKKEEADAAEALRVARTDYDTALKAVAGDDATPVVAVPAATPALAPVAAPVAPPPPAAPPPPPAPPAPVPKKPWWATWWGFPLVLLIIFGAAFLGAWLGSPSFKGVCDSFVKELAVLRDVVTKDGDKTREALKPIAANAATAAKAASAAADCDRCKGKPEASKPSGTPPATKPPKADRKPAATPPVTPPASKQEKCAGCTPGPFAKLEGEKYSPPGPTGKKVCGLEVVEKGTGAIVAKIQIDSYDEKIRMARVADWHGSPIIPPFLTRMGSSASRDCDEDQRKLEERWSLVLQAMKIDTDCVPRRPRTV